MINLRPPCTESAFLANHKDSSQSGIEFSGLWSFDHVSETVHRFPHSGVVGTIFKTKKCVVLDHLNDPSALSPKSRRAGIRGKYDVDIDSVCGVECLRSTICMPLMDTSSKSVNAVLQLANKVNGLPFNRQDEFMLKGFGNQVTVLLQSATLFDKVHSGQQLEDCLMGALESMHKLHVNSDPHKGSEFHKWTEDTANSFVPGSASVLYWFNPEGRPVHPQNLNPKSANAVQHVVAFGMHQVEIGSGNQEAILYAPVKGSGDILGVLEVIIRVDNRCILGDWVFSSLETDVLCQFAEQVGVFIECMKS